MGIVAVLDGPKATAWVYDYGSHLQVQFQKPGMGGIEGRLYEFALPRPFYRSLLDSALRLAAYAL